MDEKLFDELLRSAGEALDHAKGKRELRTTVLPPPPKPMSADDLRRLRTRVNASQAVFASSLNVSTKLVQAWESGRRRPAGAALVLLRLAKKRPGLVFEYASRAEPKARNVAEGVCVPAKRAAPKPAGRR